MKKKSKGGKRVGAGRKPLEVRKEVVTIYTDVSRFGGKEGTRMAIYAFLDGFLGKSYMKEKTPIKHLTKPKKDFTPQEQSKANLSSDSRPKTLDDLKKLCPDNLNGFDRSNWIATERQKYNI